MAPSGLVLHHFYKSSCSARVRTAAAYKGIKLELVYEDIDKLVHKQPEYKKVNPCQSVPTLTFKTSSGEDVIIRQSVSILEFFEEAFPDTKPLLPKDPIQRAKVRDFVNIISNEIQPCQNNSVRERVARLAGEGADLIFAVEAIEKGLTAYDSLAKEYGGKYSVGDEVTLADVVLAPQVENAIKVNIDLKEKMPKVWEIYNNVKDLDAFRAGDWRHQEDDVVS
jgi:maleylacetoacetate isomerase